jgi:radical SAM family RiPP maturation amino acid epimerase
MKHGGRAALRNLAAERYREIFDRRSAGEIRTLAHVKRFVERYVADPRFRDELKQNPEAPHLVVEAYGMAFDPRQALPLFRADHMRFRYSEEEARWPVAKAWDHYLRELAECRALHQRAGDCPDANPRFHAWRHRQIRRGRGELGVIGSVVTHPVLAFELSAGCSVGCWFCGVSAERFRGNFPYTTENAHLWSAILDYCVDLFGTAAQTGFCYWATDPADNPDYPRFIEDYHAATGGLPQTTTAAPLRDIAFTREILRLFDQHRCVANRFSILSLKMLDAVHAAFSAEELMGVDLVLQNRESLTPKAAVGRVRERQRRGQLGEPGSVPLAAPDYATIACVSGFLVNMVNRRIQLVTPTRCSELWPLGYRVFGERRFGTAPEFRAAIKELIDAHMPEEIASADVLGFRDDLTYHRKPNGFELRTRNGHFALGGFIGAGRLGDMIHRGDMTAGEIQGVLTRSGADIFVVVDAMQQLFDSGLLNEDPKLGGIGSAAAHVGGRDVLTPGRTRTMLGVPLTREGAFRSAC